MVKRAVERKPGGGGDSRHRGASIAEDKGPSSEVQGEVDPKGDRSPLGGEGQPGGAGWESSTGWGGEGERGREQGRGVASRGPDLSSPTCPCPHPPHLPAWHLTGSERNGPWEEPSNVPLQPRR